MNETLAVRWFFDGSDFIETLDTAGAQDERYRDLTQCGLPQINQPRNDVPKPESNPRGDRPDGENLQSL